MDTTMSEVVQFIQENDVKFIRLAFCDIFGNQKNIAIMPTELERAFEQGIHFNAAALRGFLNVEASDLLLFPDPATLSVLPWRPAQGRVVRFYCDIRYPDGTPFEGDGRHLLREANRRARRAGYSLTMGTASEFYMASSSGLFASFLPKPLPHAPGSGLHLSVSINKNGKNLFQPSFEKSAEGQSFVAGILQRAAEMTIFCNPLTNSFQRLGEFEAPKYITWSHQNSRPLITVPLSEDSTAHRFKLRAFDGCINPYIVFALLIHAGLDGIEQGLPLPPACDENLFTASDEVRARYETLPGALCDAIRIAKDSDFITKYLPEKARTAFFAAKQAEHDRIVLADDRTAAERSLYFERY